MDNQRRSVCAAAALLPFTTAFAQERGSQQPIRIVVPLGPGSAFDSGTRVLADAMAKVLNQPVIVENKPGADQVIAVREMLKAPPDGHTLVGISNSTISINPFMIKDLGYDPSEIKPVAGLFTSTSVFVVAADSKISSLSEIINSLKRRPESITLANYTVIGRLLSKYLEQVASIRFANVPYKTVAQVHTDLIGGNVNVAMMGLAGALPLVRAGRLRALAITSEKRVQSLPDVPTFAELGWPALTMGVWAGYAVRSTTPEPAIQRLQDAIRAASAQPAVLKWMNENSIEPLPLDSAGLQRLIAKETAIFKPLADSLR